MTKWIHTLKERASGQISVTFGFPEERPTLTTRTGNTFQRIRDELFSGLTDSERAIVLLNVCSVEAAEQAQTRSIIDRIEREKSEPTDPDSELPPERQPDHHPGYFIDTTPDGLVRFQWFEDCTTVTLKLTPDGATRLGADLKGFGEHVLSFQKDGGS